MCPRTRGAQPTTAMKNVLITLLLGVFANGVTSAATKTWSGSGLNDRWSTPENWSPYGAPQDGDALRFAGFTVHQSNVNDLTNLLVQSIVFSGNSYSISGNPIRLLSNITGTDTVGH